MRLIMRIRVSSATPTSPKNNRATHTHTHTRTVYVRGPVISIILMCIWFCPFSRLGGKPVGVVCFSIVCAHAWTCHVQLQLIELAATHNENLQSTKIFLEFGYSF